MTAVISGNLTTHKYHLLKLQSVTPSMRQAWAETLFLLQVSDQNFKLITQFFTVGIKALPVAILCFANFFCDQWSPQDLWKFFSERFFTFYSTTLFFRSLLSVPRQLMCTSPCSCSSLLPVWPELKRRQWAKIHHKGCASKGLHTKSILWVWQGFEWN